MSAELEARARAILERLVAFDSVSDRSNLPLVDFVEDYLRALGVGTRRAPNWSYPLHNLALVLWTSMIGNRKVLFPIPPTKQKTGNVVVTVANESDT